MSKLNGKMRGGVLFAHRNESHPLPDRFVPLHLRSVEVPFIDFSTRRLRSGVSSRVKKYCLCMFRRVQRYGLASGATGTCAPLARRRSTYF